MNQRQILDAVRPWMLAAEEAHEAAEQAEAARLRYLAAKDEYTALREAAERAAESEAAALKAMSQQLLPGPVVVAGE